MRLALAAVLSAVTILPIAAQQQTVEPLEQSLNDLLSGALTVHINARLVDPAYDETVWDMDLTRITISGRSVSVRLEGNNITVVADFTPYWTQDEELMLVAHGQTWLREYDGDNSPEYRTSFTTLPIRLGEPILFLPLGSGEVPVDTERYGRLNIELEINVERYES